MICKGYMRAKVENVIDCIKINGDLIWSFWPSKALDCFYIGIF